MATEQWKRDHVADLRLYRRRWYRKNAGHAKSKIIERRKEIKRHIALYKSAKGCARCPEHHPACLQFHHVDDDKEMCVATAIQHGWSVERLEEEIAKCVVLCANCHMKLHYENGTQGRHRTCKPSVLETAALPVELPA